MPPAKLSVSAVVTAPLLTPVMLAPSVAVITSVPEESAYVPVAVSAPTATVSLPVPPVTS